MGQTFPPWWNRLPFVSAIVGSLDPTVAIAAHTLRQPGLDVPSAAFRQDTILTEDIQ